MTNRIIEVDRPHSLILEEGDLVIFLNPQTYKTANGTIVEVIHENSGYLNNFRPVLKYKILTCHNKVIILDARSAICKL